MAESAGKRARGGGGFRYSPVETLRRNPHELAEERKGKKVRIGKYEAVVLEDDPDLLQRAEARSCFFGEFGPEHDLLDKNPGEFGPVQLLDKKSNAWIWCSNVSAEAIADLWSVMPKELANHKETCELHQKTHYHASIEKIERMLGGELFLAEICKQIRHLLPVGGGVYRVLDLEAVLRNGNESPFHQDKWTGHSAFDRDIKHKTTAQEAPYGCRVLLDLGPNADGHPGRAMQFRRGMHGDLLYSTTSRLVAMNAGAAGSGGQGAVYHGRVGDGVTITFDLVLPELSRVKVAKRATTPGTGVYRHFGITDAVRLGLGAAPGHDGLYTIAGGVGAARTSALDNKAACIFGMSQVDASLGDGAASISLDALESIFVEAAKKELQNASTKFTPAAIESAVEGLVGRCVVDPFSTEHCYQCLSHTDGRKSKNPNWKVKTFDGAEKRLCIICDLRLGFTGKGKGSNKKAPVDEIPGCKVLGCKRCTISGNTIAHGSAADAP